jgi:type II secretory pathway pseudopilin PulG
MKKYIIKNSGYTLTELLVVCATILIMCGVTLIYLSFFSPSAKLKGEAAQIVNEIRKTQNFAMSEQLIYVIRFNKADNNYSISKIQYDYEYIVETVTLTSGIHFINSACFNNGNLCKVRYNSAGTPQYPEDITIQNSKGEQSTVVVEPSGYIKIQ